MALKKKSFWLTFLISATFLVTVCLFSVMPVAAISSPWVRWKINLTFPKDALDAELVIQRGHTTQSGTHVIDDEETYALLCQTTGTPVVADGQVTFDGSSYYTCAVPSIQQQALQLWQLSIPDRCASKRPYLIGAITVDGNPSDATPENPLFYRDDIQFDVPLDTSAQEATLAMTFGQESATSSAFTLAPAGHSFAAYIARSGPGTFSPAFMVDGNNLSATPATITQAPVLSNLQSTIYFGYSPLSGDYFAGAAGPLQVDPVCPTTG